MNDVEIASKEPAVILPRRAAARIKRLLIRKGCQVPFRNVFEAFDGA